MHGKSNVCRSPLKSVKINHLGFLVALAGSHSNLEMSQSQSLKTPLVTSVQIPNKLNKESVMFITSQKYGN